MRRPSILAVLVPSVVLAACIAKVDDTPSTVLVNPTDPSETVATTPTVAALCGTICDALIESYGVPTNLRSACVFECAGGFKDTPDACYELVSCVADHSLCSGTDISPSCLARAADCLPHWSLANGSCRGCWQPSRTVHGKQIVTYLSDGTPPVDPQPEDFSGLTIGALLPRANRDPYRFPGTGASDGTYVIPSVPGCGVWIQVGTTYTWAGNADVDTSYFYQGRKNVPRASDGTTYELTIRNLVPWTDQDWFVLIAPQPGNFNGVLPRQSDSTPAVGATSATISIAAPAANDGLIDPTQHDRLYFEQLASRTTSDGAFVREIRRYAYAPPTFRTVDGQPNPLTVDLVDLAPTTTTTLDWRRSTFEALAADLHPASHAGTTDVDPLTGGPPTIVSRGDLAIWAHPGRPRAHAPTYELVDITRDAQPGDVGPLAVSWAVPPFEQGWGIDVAAAVSHYVLLTDRLGSKRPHLAPEVILMAQPLDRMSGPIVARVSPPRNVRIDGRAATSEFTGDNLTLTPTLAWDPPSLGEPEQYEITVIKMLKNVRRSPPVATFVIPRLAGADAPALHEMTIPPGILERGADYYFSLASTVTTIDERSDQANTVTSEYRP